MKRGKNLNFWGVKKKNRNKKKEIFGKSRKKRKVVAADGHFLIYFWSVLENEGGYMKKKIEK